MKGGRLIPATDQTPSSNWHAPVKHRSRTQHTFMAIRSVSIRKRGALMEDCLPHLLRPSRREVIAGAGASALALTAGPGFAARSLVASGTVFEATSADGQRRQGDQGLANVLVSNGRDVVKTDADGRWRLPIAHGDSVFVVKPPNWSTPLGPHSLPRFSYLHQPLGSPTSHRYAGVTATGPLPEFDRLCAHAPTGKRPLPSRPAQRHAAGERGGTGLPARRHHRRSDRQRRCLRHQPR